MHIDICFEVELGKEDREIAERIAAASERQAVALEELVKQQRQLHRTVGGEIIFGKPTEQKEG